MWSKFFIHSSTERILASAELQAVYNSRLDSRVPKSQIRYPAIEHDFKGRMVGSPEKRGGPDLNWRSKKLLDRQKESEPRISGYGKRATYLAA